MVASSDIGYTQIGIKFHCCCGAFRNNLIPDKVGTKLIAFAIWLHVMCETLF